MILSDTCHCNKCHRWDIWLETFKR